MPDGRNDPMDVWLRNGRLHLTCAAYERHLRACPAIALLVREGRWLLFPLASGAGGLQVKQRNARGDRVVEAQEFFRAQGFEDSPRPRELRVRDESEHGALCIELVEA